MSRPVRGVLLDTVNNTVGEHTMNGTLEDIYKALNCRCFAIPERRINGEYYSIYCDDEGLLNQAPVISGVNGKNELMLVGSLFICKHDYEGDTVGLTDDEVHSILNAVRYLLFTDLTVRPVIVMEY